LFFLGGHDSAVGISTSLQLGRKKDLDSWKNQEHFLPTASKSALGITKPLSDGYWNSFLEGKTDGA
jgi:hypothetical protein